MMGPPPAAAPVRRDHEETGEPTLIKRLKAGNTDAIGEVYDEHHEHVRAFARTLVGDAETAEDLVHEVFVSLPRAIARFQGASSLRTFLIAIAINHARHHLRSAARRRAAMERLSREPLYEREANPEQRAVQASLAEALA